MSIFQPSVLKSHIALLDQKAVDKAYKQFAKYFLDPKIQENIKTAKEEQYQATFLNELFVKIMGYTLFPDKNHNLVTEQKNEGNSRKADGAILKGDAVTAVIELKGTKTKDLESIRKQAFDYKNFNTGCNYVITSNFEKLRFYIDDASNHEEFDLFSLSRKQFELLYLCINKEQLLQHTPKTIKEESLVEEEKITKSFYKDYSLFKRELWKDLAKNNLKPLKLLVAQHKSVEKEIIDDIATETDDEFIRLEKNVKRTLFKKSQKLIDRFLFIFFAEDRGLLQPNYTFKTIEEWETVRKLGVTESLYDRFKLHFNHLDQGRKSGDGISEIFAYNGGLFKPDVILDNIVINDELLLKHTKKIAAYDFESQVDVNILGHIFENSLNEIESVNAEIDGNDFDKQTSKRKKDGVFYTPKYITKYIVDNTVGKLCEEKKTELGFHEEEYYRGRKNRNKSTLENLIKILGDYRAWLLQLTICDPACGSGAFLNQALDFLITEHNYIDDLKTRLLGGSMALSDIENTILENNIYGVDLNEESVEIAKLSLWLRTAQPRRKLNDLSSNIKCGNSLIDVKAIAGDKAFKWEEEFPQVFVKGGFDVVIGNPPYVQLQKMKDFSLQVSKLKYDTYESTGDLYSLFYEKGLLLMKVSGCLGFITSNKWMRANYGKSLRSFFIKNTNPYTLIDLGAGVFESAVVDSNIILFKKEKVNSINIKALTISAADKIKDFSFESEQFVDISPKGDHIWIIENKSTQQLLEKINSKGISLKKWDVKIHYGIKTGFNDAFIIDNTVKEKLVNQDSKSLELIKPILRGRDIKAYVPEYANLWLIGTFPALNLDINSYVAIKKYLELFGKKLNQTGETFLNDKGVKQKSRKKTRNKWFETQDTIAYHKSFEGPKILYPNMTKFLPFIYDESNNYTINDKAFMITGAQLKYLVVYLNSSLAKYQIRRECAELQGGTRELRKVYMENIRIPLINKDNEVLFNLLNDRMYSLHTNNNLLDIKFSKYIKSKFSLEKLSKKLQNWHELEFGDFIKELSKSIKAQNRQAAKDAVLDLGEKEGEKRESTPVHVIPELTKTDEFEWMELFEKKKKEVLELQSQINQTEKEIDQMVYELYGLSDEEIAIVENS
jgi:type I restriction-modification system DNA methylase subunit